MPMKARRPCASTSRQGRKGRGLGNEPWETPKPGAQAAIAAGERLQGTHRNVRRAKVPGGSMAGTVQTGVGLPCFVWERPGGGTSWRGSGRPYRASLYGSNHVAPTISIGPKRLRKRCLRSAPGRRPPRTSGGNPKARSLPPGSFFPHETLKTHRHRGILIEWYFQFLG